MHDEVGPTDKQWTAYYQYLMYLKDKIIRVRENFLFKNDDSLLINKQKSPFELYLTRNKHLKKEISELTEEDLE
jgi:hypothetical protein